MIAHLIAWVCFLSLPYIFLPRPRTGTIRWTDNMIATYVVINLFLVGFYYFNTKILIPAFFKTKKWLIYGLCVLACFIVFLYAPKPISQAIAKPETSQLNQDSNFRSPQSQFRSRPKNPTHYPSSYLGFILVFSVGLTVSVIQEWLKSEEKKKEIEHEKMNTELSLLKSQINPHFFFNTLNNIYSLAITKSDETPSSILKLSSIMRYVLTETQQDHVPLSQEIEFVKNFIDLQSVRLTDKVKVQFTVEGNVDNRLIAPLLFIPFIENAFKYGVSTVEYAAIDIRIASLVNSVTLDVKNTVSKTSKHINGNTTGIGMANVSRRLELLYAGKHKLTTYEKDNLYIVHLELFV